MDFDLSEDQLALRDGARALLDDLAPTDPGPCRRPRRRSAGTGSSGPRWWTRVGSAIAVPEGEGGVGLGPVELGVLLEEVGRHVAPVPFADHRARIEIARRAGDVRAVEQLLSGERDRVRRLEPAPGRGPSRS